jgi:WNK lysine deficient protein kinase
MSETAAGDLSSRFAQSNTIVRSEPNICFYTAYDSTTGNLVSLAERHLQEISKPQLDRLMHLLKRIATLSCPYLVRLITFGIDTKRNVLFAIAEDCGIHSIKRVISEGIQFKFSTASRWFFVAVEVLAYLQSVGMAHGVITIRTIFIKGKDSVKLTMPIPAFFGSRRFHIRYWTPPEALVGISDIKSDVWMLGQAVLFAVTRTRPYSNCATPMQLYQKLAAAEIPEEINIVKDEAAANFIRRCLVPYKDRPLPSDLQKDVFLLAGAQNKS